jgi:arginyl-tRNA synthetase
MNIRTTLHSILESALTSFGVPKDMVKISLDHPTDPKHGDYSTSVAMQLAKNMGASTKNPLDLAQKIADKITAELPDANHFIEKVTVAAPGFINFYLTKKFFVQNVEEVLKETLRYGKNTKLWNKKVIIEHTNLNPFKPFHIGHIVNNAIGESLSRVLEFQDAKLTRATYGGDVGLHVAKTLWGVLKLKDEQSEDFFKKATLNEQVDFLGKAYAFGAQAYDEEENSKKEILELNKKVWEKTDDNLNELYQWGRRVSLEHFIDIYKKLGSKFDYYILESEVADEGIKIVKSGLDRGIFRESEGAIIFPGEEHGLHNRVFINSQGWPTYEAKELGLLKKKFQIHDFDQSITITGNEQNDYFKVVQKTAEFIYPEIAKRMIHVGHGMMRFASGKMSSRKGNVITGESLLADTEEMVLEKMADRKMSESEKQEVAAKIAVAAIKYSILKQSTGKDIIFDQEKSLSFEGDSGPYLQYTYVRAKSILAKAKDAEIEGNTKIKSEEGKIFGVERLLYQFPEIVERTAEEKAPNYIATYLINLAAEFNKYYAKNKIVDPKDEESAYRVALTEAVSWTLKNGLWLLGIEVPEKM